jgi:hypothetical protein
VISRKKEEGENVMAYTGIFVFHGAGALGSAQGSPSIKALLLTSIKKVIEKLAKMCILLLILNNNLFI